MSDRTLSFTFRPGLTIAPAVILDGPVRSTGSGAWSGGGQAPAPINDRPRPGELWTISGWVIRWRGFMNVSVSPSYGRPGRLYAGLTRQIFDQHSQGDDGVGLQGIPSDALNTIGLLWDGSTDPSPPQTPLLAPPLSLPADWRVQSVVLAQPFELREGEQLGAGLWLTPGVTNQFYPGVLEANGTLLFDKQQTPRVPL